MGTRLDRLTKRLRSEGEALVQYLRSLPEDTWSQQIYASEEECTWDLRQLLWHILDAERGFHTLIRDIIAGGEGAPPNMDIDEHNRSQMSVLADRSPKDLLGDFQLARRANIDLIQSITEPDLDLQGRHPFLGWTNLEACFKLIYRHNMLHMRDVKRKVN